MAQNRLSYAVFRLSTVAPKPRAEGSSPSAPAKSKSLRNGLHKPFLGLFLLLIPNKNARHVVCESPFDAQNEHQFVQPVPTIPTIPSATASK